MNCASCGKLCAPLEPKYLLTIRRGLVTDTLPFHNEECFKSWCSTEDDALREAREQEAIQEALDAYDPAADGYISREALDELGCPLEHPHCDIDRSVERLYYGAEA